MPTDRQRRIEALIQEDADHARAQGYESTAKVHEKRLTDYRAANARDADGQQQAGQ